MTRGSYRARSSDWVWVSGTSTVIQDRRAIRELYQPDWRAWFGDEGGERNGGPDDPRIALILVEAESVVYSKKDRPAPLQLFSIVKAMVTGSAPKTADLRTLDEAELRQAEGR